MSTAGNKKNKCVIKSNGEKFRLIFDGVNGNGLCFTLQELKSKDYLGIIAGSFSKSPYFWSISSAYRGILNGEWEFCFDDDIKSVVAYSHKTFFITLYDADRNILAMQKVSHSNFETGLNLSNPDGTRPGGYLDKFDRTSGDDNSDTDYRKDVGKLSDDVLCSDSVKSVVEIDGDGSYEHIEQDNDEVIIPQNEQEVHTNNTLLDGNKNQNSSETVKEVKSIGDENVYTGVIDDAISHNGGYVKESLFSLKLVLRIFIIFIIIFVVLVVFLMFGKVF